MIGSLIEQTPLIGRRSYLYGILILQAVQVVALRRQAVLRGVLVVGGVGGLWGRRGVGAAPGQTRGPPRGGLVPLHHEGDGGGGASKKSYCLVMSGLCHVYTIDLDRQQNQPIREETAHSLGANGTERAASGPNQLDRWSTLTCRQAGCSLNTNQEV